MYLIGMTKFLNKNYMKHKAIIFHFLIAVLFILFSCSSTSDSSQENENSNSKFNSDVEDENNVEKSGCKYEDGTYSATVDYYNPETGYSSTYTLDIDVQDCQVNQIDFPNDGYLNEDHISYADVDEDGNASVDGEDGKTYEIHIDDE
jgi:hypothetical protein